MIYGTNTHYLDSTSSKRLVRYDVIEKSRDHYVVKVIDAQNAGQADPKILIEVFEFEITKDAYANKYKQGGFQQSVETTFKPTFDSYINDELQAHRNSLD